MKLTSKKSVKHYLYCDKCCCSDFNLLNLLIVENSAVNDKKRKENKNSEDLTAISENDETKEKKKKNKNKNKLSNSNL